MSTNIPASFISAWSEREVEIKFERPKQRLEALQKAAARIINEAACQIEQNDDHYFCYLVKRDPKMYRSVPFFGLTIVKALPPKDRKIVRRFRKLVVEENSRPAVETTPKLPEAISPLGIAETLLAVSASLLLATYLGDYTHIVVGSVLAPFFLLRTSDSNNHILRVAQRYFDWINDFTLRWYESVYRYYNLTEETPAGWIRRFRNVLGAFKYTAMALGDLALKTIIMAVALYPSGLGRLARIVGR
jgi:hypothetical protein